MAKRISYLCASLSIALIFGLAVEAQTTPPAECPTINVLGPAGIPNPDEPIPYAVELKGNVPPGVTFRWSVSTGKVVEGQGTAKIKIDAPDWLAGVSVTATVEVLGLPEGCPNTSSETMAVSIDPGPILVGSTGNATNYSTSFRELIDALEKHSNSQGYIFIGTSNSDRFQEIVRLIRDTARLSGFDQSRLTIKPEATSSEIVEIWRVPPGADNPSCRSCEPVVETLPKTGDFYMTDEWGELSIEDELGRLDLLSVEWRKRGSHYLYFYIYRGPAESSVSEQARIKRIRDRLIGKRKVPSDHIVIFGGGTAPHPVTRIYTVPPHARQYMPTRPI